MKGWLVLACVLLVSCAAGPGVLNWVPMDRDVVGATSDGKKVTLKAQWGVSAADVSAVSEGLASPDQAVGKLQAVMATYDAEALKSHEAEFKGKLVEALATGETPLPVRDVVFLTFLVE